MFLGIGPLLIFAPTAVSENEKWAGLVQVAVAFSGSAPLTLVFTIWYTSNGLAQRGFAVNLWPNWVDLFCVMLFVRGCYIGYARGVVSEFFHLAVLVCVTALGVNYWRPAAEWVHYWLAIDPVVLSAVLFWVAFLMSYLVLRTMVRRAAALLGWERLHWVVQFVSVALGAARGLWWIGLLLLTLTSSGVTYLQESAQERSLLGSRLEQPALDVLVQVTDRFPGAQYRVPPLLPPWKAPAPKGRAGS